MPHRLPTLFVSHGAPDIVLRHQASTDALRELGLRLPEPQGIVIVSAHWSDEPVGITRYEHLKTIHDFGGCPTTLDQFTPLTFAWTAGDSCQP